MGTPADTTPRFVVGIDFGTTFTSIAIVHASKPDVEHLVRGWPGGSRSGPRADAVPSEILYSTPRRFGFEIEEAPDEEQKKALRWFKLLLQTSEDEKLQVQIQKEKGDGEKKKKGLFGKEKTERVDVVDTTYPIAGEADEEMATSSVNGDDISVLSGSSGKKSLFGGVKKMGRRVSKHLSGTQINPPGYYTNTNPYAWSRQPEPLFVPKPSLSLGNPVPKPSIVLKDTFNTKSLSNALPTEPANHPPPYNASPPPPPTSSSPPPPNSSVTTPPCTSGLSSYTPSASKVLSTTSKTVTTLALTPLKITTDFLSHLFKTLHSELSITYPSLLLSTTRIDYILTIPALWSDHAKSLMTSAAVSAGFGVPNETFALVSEPEAAAAYVLHTSSSTLQPGDVFIITDAGGGTVDLISYVINSTSPLSVSELVSGSGALCGSVFLDEAFTRYMTALMPPGWVAAMKPKARRTMLSSWREEKHKFGSQAYYPDDYEISISVPGAADDEDRNIDGGFHYMPIGEVLKIFNPVVDKIKHLVGEQVTGVASSGKSVKAVILVGGFGCSRYLKSQLEDVYKPRGISVLTPGSNAQTAVARGAVLRGLDGSIVLERRARRWYGSAAHALWRKEMSPDAALRKIYSVANDRYEVPEKMFWYVKKGDPISATQRVIFPFFRHFLVQAPNHATAESRFRVNDTLYAYDPPDETTSGEGTAPEFRWRDPERCRAVGVLETDLGMIPKSRLAKVWGKKGHQYYKIAYELVMTIEGEVLKFQLQFQGQIYSMCKVKYMEDVE